MVSSLLLLRAALFFYSAGFVVAFLPAFLPSSRRSAVKVTPWLAGLGVSQEDLQLCENVYDKYCRKKMEKQF